MLFFRPCCVASACVFCGVLMEVEGGTTTALDVDVWAAVRAHFVANSLVRHQLCAFNCLVGVSMPNIVTARPLFISTKTTRWQVTFSNLFIDDPIHTDVGQMTRIIFPTECIKRSITYASCMYVDINIVATAIADGGRSEWLLSRKYIGDLPVMVMSDRCALKNFCTDAADRARRGNHDVHDLGGYFITNGSCKMLSTQERPAGNTVYVFANRKERPRYQMYAEVRSGAGTCASRTFTVGFMEGRVTCVVPFVPVANAVPFAVLMRALGCTDERDILRHLTDDMSDEALIAQLMPSFEVTFGTRTQHDALLFIGRCAHRHQGGAGGDEGVAIAHATRLLDVELLPHMGSTGTGAMTTPEENLEELRMRKRHFVGYMVARLVAVKLGRESMSDRDHYMHKRASTADPLLAAQFAQAFRRFSSIVEESIKTVVDVATVAARITSAIRPAFLTNAMTNGIASGNWGGRNKKVGISQAYETFNSTAALACLRKLTVPIAENGKVVMPRRVHGSHWGVACGSETPEGKKVGLVKTMALTCRITMGADPAPIELGMREHGWIASPAAPGARVFINGRLVGTARCANLGHVMRTMRRRGDLSAETSISSVEAVGRDEIHVWTDAGRLCRPLFVVVSGALVFTHAHAVALDEGRLTWEDLLVTGCVEYLDKSEEDDAKVYVVMFPSVLESLSEVTRARVTHCELHPSMMFGVGASLIPFPDHNQSPRNAYQCIDAHAPISMADGRVCSLRDLRVGNSILTFDPATGRTHTTTVTWHHVGPTKKPMVCVELLSGAALKATKDHKFFTARGWVEAGNLGSGDEVATDELDGEEEEEEEEEEEKCRLAVAARITFERVVSVTGVGSVEVGDLTTASETHCFFAGGMAVHNSAMGKQAIGYPSANFLETIQGPTNVLEHIQRPLAMTRGSVYACGYDVQPAGQNAMVAVMPWHGYGQEDSLIINLTSVERGFMCVTQYRVFYTEVRRDRQECIERPQRETCNNSYGNAAFLDQEGIACIGARLRAGDIVIGKTITAPTPPRAGGRHATTDISLVYDEPIPATVHRIERGTTGEAYEYIRVIVAQSRPPGVGGEFQSGGDKFSCYTADHMVLTLTGWVDIGAVGLHHKVATLLHDGEVAFLHPTATTVGYSTAEHIRVANLCTVTDNHNMYVRHAMVCQCETCLSRPPGPSVEQTSWRLVTALEMMQTTENITWSVMLSIDPVKEGEATRDIQPNELTFVPNALCKPVYCCTMPGQVTRNVVYVRQQQGGEAFWCGNSRHGQKGTIGTLVPSVDMPFTRGGEVPDLIMNPLALPSRMTIAHLIECLVGKALLASSWLHTTPISGAYASTGGGTAYAPFARSWRTGGDVDTCVTDATPFRPFAIHDVVEELKRCGLDGFGDEVMFSGETGERLSALIFFGPVYYQRLKHMVIDKGHGRGRGPRQTMTRQPREGRSNDGGLRIGRMEADAIAASGAPYLIKDRLFLQSDRYSMWVCQICGLPAIVSRHERICQVCNTQAGIVRVDIPYGTKLMFQELLGLNVVPRILPALTM